VQLLLSIIKMKSMKSVPKQDNCLLQIRDCGIADYRQILQTQQLLRAKRQQNEIPNTVLIVEHPAVITLGARQSSNKLLVNRDDLAQKHIDVVDVRRGGGTTAHNPGQLVFYPILNLQKTGLGINEYIRELEAIGEAKRRPRFMDRRKEDRFYRRTRVEIYHLSRHGHKHPKRPEHFRFHRTVRAGQCRNDISAKRNRQTPPNESDKAKVSRTAHRALFIERKIECKSAKYKTRNPKAAGCRPGSAGLCQPATVSSKPAKSSTPSVCRRYAAMQIVPIEASAGREERQQS